MQRVDRAERGRGVSQGVTCGRAGLCPRMARATRARTAYRVRPFTDPGTGGRSLKVMELDGNGSPGGLCIACPWCGGNPSAPRARPVDARLLAQFEACVARFKVIVCPEAGRPRLVTDTLDPVTAAKVLIQEGGRLSQRDFTGWLHVEMTTATDPSPRLVFHASRRQGTWTTQDGPDAVST